MGAAYGPIPGWVATTRGILRVSDARLCWGCRQAKLVRVTVGGVRQHEMTGCCRADCDQVEMPDEVIVPDRMEDVKR